MATQIGTAYVDVQPDLSSVVKQTSAFFAGSKWGSIGKTAAVGLGGIAVAGAAAAKALFDVGAEFDAAYDKIQTSTGATRKEMRRLEGSFKNVVGSLPTDFDTAATAVAGLNQRLGLTGKPLNRLSKQIVALSDITGTDVQENVESITRLFGDWSIKTGEQTETLDKMFRLTQQTGISMSTLSRFMVQFGSPLRQLGINFDNAAAMFAQFEQQGVNLQTLMPGLRFALKTFSGAVPETTAELKKLGVSFKDPERAMADVMKLIADAPTDLKANAIAFKVFGQRAGPDMAAAIREGRFEFSDLIENMRQGEGTIRQQERRTRDLSEQWKLFANRLKVLVEPVARDVFEGLGDLMRDVNRAFKRGGLAGVGKLIADRLQSAIPKIVDAGVEIGKALGPGLIKGFINSSPILKFAAGTWLGAKFFDDASIEKAGRRFGLRFGKGLIVGAILVIPELGYELGQWLKKDGFDLLKKWGAAAGEFFVNELIAVVNIGIEQINEMLDKANVLAFAGVEAPELGPIGPVDFTPEDDAERQINAMKILKTRGIDALIRAYQRLGLTHKEAFLRAGEVQDRWLKNLEGGANTISDRVMPGAKTATQLLTREGKRGGEGLSDGIREGGKKGGRHLDDFAREGKRTMGRAANTFGHQTKGIANTTDQNLGDAENKGSRHGRNLEKNLGGNIRGLAQTTYKGMGSIAGNVVEALHGLNVKKIPSFSFKQMAESEAVGGAGRQRGGMIVPGTGFGDKVPVHVGGELAAWTEPGELISVANRKATERIMAINKQVPRFQEGGVFQSRADVDGSGPGFIPYMNYLNSLFGPLSVISGFRAGSITTSGNVSNHSWGGAVDISTPGGEGATAASPMTGEMGSRMDAAHQWIASKFAPINLDLLWRTMTGGNHFNHIHSGIARSHSFNADAMRAFISKLPEGGAFGALKRVLLKGPPGPLRDYGQAALDRFRKAGDQYIGQHTNTAQFGVTPMGDVHGERYISTSYGPPWGGIQGTGVTATGVDLTNSPQIYGVAVDPDVIPLGTRLAIAPNPFNTGTPFKAFDTGGAIQGNRIDFYDWRGRDEQLGWGTRPVQVEAMRRGGILGRMIRRLQTGGLLRGPSGGVGPGGGGGNGQGGGGGNGHGGQGGGGIFEATMESLDLQKFIHKIRRSEGAGDRRTLTGEFTRGVNNLGLGPAFGLLEGLRGEVAQFDEWASNAEATDSETADGVPIWGMFGGQDSLFWIREQLGAMFKLRNRLISAIEQVAGRRDWIAGVVDHAGRVLGEVKEQIKQAEKRIKELQEKIEDAQERIEDLREDRTDLMEDLRDEKAKDPKKQDKQKIERLENQIAAKTQLIGGELKNIEDWRHEITQERRANEPRGWVEAALTTVREDALTPQLESIGSILADDLTPELETLHGIGQAATILDTLPAFPGLGGEIFQAQAREQQMMNARNAPAEATEDDESGVAEERLALTQQLLTEAQQRLLVSQLQYPVFTDFSRAPVMHEGGQVPGPYGADVPIVAQAGEWLTPDAQRGPVIIIEDGAVREDRIKLIAANGTRESISVARRSIGGRR